MKLFSIIDTHEGNSHLAGKHVGFYSGHDSVEAMAKFDREQWGSDDSYTDNDRYTTIEVDQKTRQPI